MLHDRANQEPSALVGVPDSSPMAEPVDDDLLAQFPEASAERYTGSDPHDFAGLYIRHRSSFASHARRFLRDQRDIDEVVQEAFLRLFLALPELETELQALAYCRRTVTNLCIDRYRAEQRRPRLVELGELPDSAVGEESNDAVVQAEDAAIVREALSRLTPMHRAALVKREIEEKPLPVIADELDIPVETVKHVLHRARRALRRLLVGTAVEPGVDLDDLEIMVLVKQRAASGGGRLATAVLVMAALALALPAAPELGALGRVSGVDLPASDAFARPPAPSSGNILAPLSGVAADDGTSVTAGERQSPRVTGGAGPAIAPTRLPTPTAIPTALPTAVGATGAPAQSAGPDDEVVPLATTAPTASPTPDMDQSPIDTKTRDRDKPRDGVAPTASPSPAAGAGADTSTDGTKGAQPAKERKPAPAIGVPQTHAPATPPAPKPKPTRPSFTLHEDGQARAADVLQEPVQYASDGSATANSWFVVGGGVDAIALKQTIAESAGAEVAFVMTPTLPGLVDESERSVRSSVVSTKRTGSGLVELVARVVIDRAPDSAEGTVANGLFEPAETMQFLAGEAPALSPAPVTLSIRVVYSALTYEVLAEQVTLSS